MTSFNDLPTSIRERIYRLHLVHDEPITFAQHCAFIWETSSGKESPAMLQVSQQLDQDAAAIYYGENTFDLGRPYGSFSSMFFYDTEPRYLRMIRKVSCDFNSYTSDASGMFRALSRLKGLEELTIRTDERAMINKLLVGHRSYRRMGIDGPTPQQQLVMLRYPGVAALLAHVKVPLVRFVGNVDEKGVETKGPIQGGVLMTQVLPRVLGERVRIRKPRARRFRFLSLPPELRNRIYSLLLLIPGPVELSKGSATSSSKKYALKKHPSESVLSLLATSRQIHDEGAGVFYGGNSFVFNYSIHLHAFLSCLALPKQSLLRDLTVHYVDVKSGGMSLVDFTFVLLEKLTALKRLEVVMQGDLTRKIAFCYTGSRMYSIDCANPALLPGMSSLFNIRSNAQMIVRDSLLEAELKEAKEDESYPDYPKNSRNWCIVKLDRVLAHFNDALSNPHKRRDNYLRLRDNHWHLKDVFPSLEANV